MGKSIYTYYKDRLVEIGGSSKCLYLKNVVRKSAYDIGKIFEGRDGKIQAFSEFLRSEGRLTLPLITPEEKSEIIKNLEPQGGKRLYTSADEGRDEKPKKKAFDPEMALEGEVSKIRELKREVEEIERETGRCELYIGYPFVFGSITRGISKSVVKAPLMLFPVKIEISDEQTAEIRLNEKEKIHINPALVFAYSQAKKLNIDKLELEFEDISDFRSVKDVTDYLKRAGIKIDCSLSKNIYSYSRFKEPDLRSGALSVRFGAVLARFPLSNSIYNDYSLLEKKNLTNDAIDELLRTKKSKPKKKAKKRPRRSDRNSYAIKMLDFAQAEVVRKVDENGNMVIYGPPGTGKSQTIVNIIADALCKNKRVLVVSQKKAALDVVYSRLGALSKKAMYLTDESKEKHSFYERCLEAHQSGMIESLEDTDALESEYNEIESRIRAEIAKLDTISETFNSKRSFGLSLAEMYSSSSSISKSSSDYSIYLKMMEDERIMALDYKALKNSLFGIRSLNIEKTYYDHIEDKKKNPLIDNMLPGVDIFSLSEARGALEEKMKSRKGLFEISKYPLYRQALAYFPLLDDEKNLNSVVKLEKRLKAAGAFSGFGSRRRARAIKDDFINTIQAIKGFAVEYEFLRKIMNEDGYLAVIDNLLRGNTSYLKLVFEAIDGYITKRDTSTLLSSLDEGKSAILDFAYSSSKSYQGFIGIIDKLLEIRIYHEVIKAEEECREELSLTVDYPNITSKIYKLKEEQLGIAYKLSAGKNSKIYDTLYANAKNNKDYLYQISKKQKYWPIRKTMEVYSDFILTLFPCWLLSPENVSSFLPLEKNLFDLVIFDEASQVFIESTIPTIYRGKNIVVAGDAKQLRPSATFMKRYLGGDPENQQDLSVQAALEVESLLDLAVARYESANLTYHYRSRHQELIDFSNSAFYSSGLQISQNLSKNTKNAPIERYLVDGRWVDRRNTAEAEKIVELLKGILAKRKNNESIGIITFNSDQQTCIADLIDKTAMKDARFRKLITPELNRTDGGEDTSLFVKNLENVQGEERDIIIFSIGYAKNDQGKIYTNFGSLSTDGGENRLNVAITRAKSKIIVVTSIEPEELKVDTAKNDGPKLLKSYLSYVRSVASGDREQAKASLSRLEGGERATGTDAREGLEEQIAERLRRLGYTVDTRIGNTKNRISLAIYDEKEDRYLVGVELDKDAFGASEYSVERDVYKPKFLEARGWRVMRVWSRDWWLSPTKVIKAITTAAERSRAKT